MNGAIETAASQTQQPLRREHVAGTALDLLRIADICARGGFSRDTWGRWVKCGKAPAPVPNIPGHPRWSAESIERFFQGRQTTGRSYFKKAQR